MLVKVDVCGEDGDQQGNYSPSRKSGEQRDEKTNSQPNLKHTAQIDQLQMKRQIWGHDFEEELWTAEVHHTCKDHQDRQKPLWNRFDSRHLILVTAKDETGNPHLREHWNLG